MPALSLRRVLLMTAALALSLATAMIVHAWVEQARLGATAASAPAAPLDTKQVLVATHVLPAGQFLKPNDLDWQPWPAGGIAPDFILQGSRTIDDIVGSVVRSGIAAGEPITDSRLIKKGDRGFLSAVMAPDTRAVTVQLQPTSGLGGLVLPGDHVDVLLTATIPGNTQGEPEHRATETVLEDIRVIAIDQKMSDLSNETILAKSATLEVTPKQAEILSLVSDMGKLSLTLRSIAESKPKPVKLDAKGEPARPSVTWDNEATDLGLLPHFNAAPSDDNKVDLVRGSESKSFDFPKGAK